MANYQSDARILRRAGNTSHRYLTCALAAFLASFSTLAQAQGPGSYSDLHDFGGSILNSSGATVPDGEQPTGAVTFDSSGNMFGTTMAGGADDYGAGTVYEITSSGTYKVLHVFGGNLTQPGGTQIPDGEAPESPIVFDAHGDMFGTTIGGGKNLGGILWEITSSGSYADEHDFGGTITNAGGSTSKDGIAPYSPIVFDAYGDIFGTTILGGPNSDGIVWEITASGLYKDLHDFGGMGLDASGTTASGGFDPGNVVLDAAGNMYGSAFGGGPNYVPGSNTALGGMIWELTSTGSYKDLHDFGGLITNSPDGIGPGHIAFDSEGNIDGTALHGGGYGDGEVWTLISGGEYAILHSFGGMLAGNGGTDFADGSSPFGVTVDSSGNIYGVTTQGGLYAGSPSAGMLWEITDTGIYKDLHDFNGTITKPNGSIQPDGKQPIGPIGFDSQGNLYGTATQGGSDGQGNLWKLVSPTAVASFSPGLSLFSLPYAYSNVDLDTLFGYSDITLAVWNPTDFSYTLTPTAPANQIALGQGYWARFPQTSTITTAGTAASISGPFTIQLAVGWNMIGDPFTSSIPLSSLTFDKGTKTFAQATASPNPLIGSIMYSYGGGMYNATASLAPYSGYWLFAYSATNMQIPPQTGG